jgi:hypothetical protein
MARYCPIADQVRVPHTMHVEFALVNSDLATYRVIPLPTVAAIHPPYRAPYELTI